MLKSVFTFFRPRKRKVLASFDKAMSMAEEIYRNNPNGLKLILNTLKNSLQIDGVLKLPLEQPLNILDLRFLKNLEKPGDDFFNHTVRVCQKEKRFLDLNQTTLIPLGRKRDSLITQICSWGADESKEFHPDTNHQVARFLPLDISLVVSGHHSITTGLMKQGVVNIKPVETYDVTNLFELIETDGYEFRRVRDGAVIHSQTNLKFAIIFAIHQMVYRLENENGSFRP